MKLTGRPKMPTYLSSAETLERKTGSGIKLLGWTVLRTLLIAPPILLVTPSEYRQRVWIGAILSSSLISSLALLRIFNAGPDGLGRGRGRSMKRLRSSRA